MQVENIQNNNLSEENWNDSQKHELSFWRGQLLQGNQEQYHRNYYYRHVLEGDCNIFMKYFENTSFDNKVLVDVGSGPEGLLHALVAKKKYAVDSLMDKYRSIGYNVEADNVTSMALSGENLCELKVNADVIFCLNALDHCKNPEIVIREIASKLKPEGVFLLQTDIRTEHQCDSLHKLSISSSELTRWLRPYFEIKDLKIIPHQGDNPIKQFVSICIKKQLSKILLVGNGPSALNMELQDEIDSFPVVARFNSFRTKGFEKYVGTKCDIWLTTDFFPAWRSLYHYKEIYYLSFNRKLNEERFLQFKKENPLAQKLPGWAWDETIKAMKYNGPSSGSVAAYYFSKVYDKVFIYGFDFFQSDKHHYGDNIEKGIVHKSTFEVAFFKNLIHEGKIIPFFDYLNIEKEMKNAG